MPNDPVQDAVAGAHKALENATKFTQSVEGNPTSSFAPKKPEAPKIPQAKRLQDAPYSLAASRKNNTVAEGLKAKSDNIDAYLKGTK